MNTKGVRVARIFYCGVKLKMANEKGKNLDFQTKVNDIIYATQEFNKHFQGAKIIKIDKVENKAIYLYLSILALESAKFDINARELTIFSKKLSNDKNWAEYSRDGSKLFGSVLFEDVTDKMSDTFDSLSAVPMSILRNSSFPIGSEVEEISDAQAIQAFEGLVAIQSIGAAETQKLRKVGIQKIKAVLFEVLK